MTEYLTEYMKSIALRLDGCSSPEELAELMAEHKDKIAFMQHERIVHFLVTMMFALILAIFILGTLLVNNLMLLVLSTILIVLEGFYIKHYYFLENTVQKMYRVYDEMLSKGRVFAAKEKSDD